MRQVVALVLMIGSLTGHAAASQARGAAATGKRLSACTLMSRDLVEKFDTGDKQVLKQIKPSEEPQINPFARPDQMRKSPGKDWQQQTGVGDTAFFRNKADTYAELIVWTGPLLKHDGRPVFSADP